MGKKRENNKGDKGSGKVHKERDIFKFVKFIIGILIIPACLGISLSFYRLFFVNSHFFQNHFWFAAGFVGYVVIYSIFQNPIKTYVYGHELTHALWTWLFRGKVKGFSANEDGGSVTVTKSNFLISLAPYFFPIYTFLAVCLYLVAISFWRVGSTGRDVFQFILGFTWAFHFVLTVFVMMKEQSDIKENGVVFSVFFIYLTNLIVLGLLFVFLSQEISLERFCVNTMDKVEAQYLYLLRLGRM
ncbi:hypothetical protein ACFLQ8_01630 [Candidatus Auribacterota bacterium]